MQKEKLQFGLNVKRRNIFEEAQEPLKVENKKNIDKKTLDIIQDALDQDADIFDYDKNYSKFSAQKKTVQKKEARYIQNLLKTAEKRKLQLEKVKIQKEIALESANADLPKEKFVTQGYLEKLKELQEQNAKVEEEGSGKNIENFYRNLLFSKETVQETEQIQEEIKEVQEGKQDVQEEILNAVKNDSEEIIDKRLYLKGGLNFTKKSSQIVKGKAPLGASKKDTKGVASKPYFKKSVDFMKQKEMVDREKELEKKELKRKIQESVESKVTDGVIASAKERYLQRRKLMQEQE